MPLPPGLTPIDQPSLPEGLSPYVPQKVEPEEKSFIERTHENVSNRFAEAQQSIVDYRAGKITPIELLWQSYGKTIAGSAVDIVGEGMVSAYRSLPESTQDAVEGQVEAMFSTPAGEIAMQAIEKGGAAYQEWKTKNPRFAKNLEVAGLVGEIYPPIKGYKAYKSWRMKNKAVPRQIPQRRLIKEYRALTPPETASVKTAQMEGQVAVTPGRTAVPLPDKRAMEMIEIVNTVPGYRAGNPSFMNNEAVKHAIKFEAETLANSLKRGGYPYSRRNVYSMINKNIDNAIGKSGDPLKVNEMLVDMSPSQIKAAKNRVKRILASNPSDVHGLLRARQQLDDYISSMDKHFFDADGAQKPISILYDQIRTTMNENIELAVRFSGGDTKVMKSLYKQRVMYDAKKILARKAAWEDKSPIGRMGQKIYDMLPHHAVATQRAINTASPYKR